MELLVTLGIVGILAALLLSAVDRARRPALVLGCPIAYIAKDGKVYLTDPNGNRHLKVCNLKATDPAICWSPEGRYVSFLSSQGTVVVNPVTQRTMVLTNFDNNHWWVNGTTLEGIRWYATGNYHDLWRVDCATGEQWCHRRLRDERLPYGQIQAKYEPYLGDGYLVCEADWTWTPTADVVMRGSEWQLTRVIWQDASNDVQDWRARVDSVGERVAWTRGKWNGAYIDEWCVAWKGLEEDPQVRPKKLGLGYESAAFCDWTPHDELLVIVKDRGKLQLAVMSIEGKILQTLPTPYGLMRVGGGAAWRRYEHW